MREALKVDCEALKTELAYTADIEKERQRVLEERAEVETLSANLIHENATVKMDQKVFNSRLEGYTQRYDALTGRFEKLGEKQKRLEQEIFIIDRFAADLDSLDEIPVDFSPSLWNAFIEKVTLYPDGRADFLFKNGAVITEQM